MIPDPTLLQHPNIPKPLHGVNPRTILGEEWWNKTRQEAYASRDYRCWACGVHKRKAVYHQWLEAHETYHIDYSIGRAEMVGVVALCHACHNFIHSGRLLAMWRNTEITTERAEGILRYGFDVLRAARLKAFYVAYIAWAEIVLKLDDPIGYAVNKQAEFPLSSSEEIVAWSDWRLVIAGVEYSPVFANYEEWEEHYQRKGNMDE